MLLHFEINDNEFFCKDPALASESINVDYIKCEFNFKSKAWKAVDAKVAVFKSAAYGVTEEVLLDNSDSCYIPSDIYKHGGIVQIVLYGDTYTSLSDGNQRKTTNLSAVMELYINPNIIVPVPTPYKYEQFTAEYVNAQKELQRLIEYLNQLVEEGAFDGVGISDVQYNSDYTVTLVLTDGTEYTSRSLRGEQGEQGLQGEQGIQGERGEQGYSISNVYLNDDYTLTVVLDDEEETSFTTPSIRGETGEAAFILGFSISSETGHLLMEYALDSHVDFSLSDNGHLILEVQND